MPPDVVVVGDVRIPADLYAVLVDEAQSRLATLTHELSLLQFDPQALPSAVMVRASHTLCGIHRTGGLPLIALTAGALEQALLALQQGPAPMPVEALPALTDAVGVLAEFLGRVRARQAFNATDVAIAAEIQQELEALRRAASVAPVAPEIELLDGGRTGCRGIRIGRRAGSGGRRDSGHGGGFGAGGARHRAGAAGNAWSAEVAEPTWRSRRTRPRTRRGDVPPVVAEMPEPIAETAPPDLAETPELVAETVPPVVAEMPDRSRRLRRRSGRNVGAERGDRAGGRARGIASGSGRSRRPNRRAAKCRRIRWRKSGTTSTLSYCRSSSRRRRSSTRRPASRCAPGAVPRAMPAARVSCAGPCTRSRAARAWPGRCAWASSCT